MDNLLPQLLVLTLDIMVTLSLWLNYRSSGMTYLGIACGAGVLEIIRQVIDNLIFLIPGIIPPELLLPASASMQFLSSFVLLYAIRESNIDGFKIKFFMPALLLAYLGTLAFAQSSAFESTVLDWGIFFLPLMIVRCAMIWWALASKSPWVLSRVFLLISSIAFLGIRGWMPFHMLFDDSYFTAYYMETLVYAMLLGALSLTAMERAQRHVQSLLEDRMQSEKDLQFILDHCLDVILVTDQSGKLLSWSTKDAEKFGYSGEQAIGKLHFSDLLADQGSLVDFEDSTEFETKMRHADGSDFRVKARVQLVERDKQLTRIYVLQDISVQHELIEQQRRLDRQLDRTGKLESLGILAGGIAHDFNNILTSLFGNISMAKQEFDSDHGARKFLDDAERSMARATHLSSQLLTFAKGGAPVKEHVFLGELIEEIARFDLSGSNVLPVIKQEQDLWVAEVDRGQMQQIFSNLTINANHAMPKGGHIYFDLRNVDILEDEVAALSAGKYILVSVRDEGLGIDKAHLERIFDPYFSTKSTGNGLGLATVYSIVTKHGGDISVESIFGQGTTFNLYLPATTKPMSCDINKPKQRLRIVPENARVLLMDDDEMIGDMATQMLEKVGYSATLVTNREEAIECYKKSMAVNAKFDLVILDLTIPGGIGGQEVVKDILRLDSDAIVVVSSGYAEDPVLAHFEQFGFKGVLPKPYTISGLEEALDKALAA